MKKLLNPDQVAEAFDIKKGTLSQWVHYKKIPYIKLNGKLMFDEELLNEFIMKNSVIPNM